MKHMLGHCAAIWKTFSRELTRLSTFKLWRSRQTKCSIKSGSKNLSLAGSSSYPGSLAKISPIKNPLSIAPTATSHFWMRMCSTFTRRANDTSKPSINRKLKPKTRPPRLRASSQRAKSLSLERLQKVRLGLHDCCNWWAKQWSQPRIKSARSSQAATPRSRKSVDSSPQQKCCKKRRIWAAPKTLLMRMRSGCSIIRSRFRWDGMESRYPTGCISCMVWVKSLSVKFVAGHPTGADVHSRNIFRSGVTPTAWSVCGFRTRVTSKMWLGLSRRWVWTKSWCRQTLRGLSSRTSKRSSRIRRAICTRANSTSIWSGKVWSD